MNDRGPFLYGRVVDLSYTAAARLGYVASGSADVEVELITRFDGPAPQAAPVGSQVALGAPAAIASGAASGAPVVAPSASVPADFAYSGYFRLVSVRTNLKATFGMDLTPAGRARVHQEPVGSRVYFY